MRLTGFIRRRWLAVVCTAVLGLTGLAVLLGADATSREPAGGNNPCPSELVCGRLIERGTVSGREIKDGSLGIKELSLKARNTLRGATGPGGPAGAPGPKGDKGDPGVAPAPPAARVFNNANIAVPGNAAFTALTFNTERFDSGLHRLDTDTGRLTVTAAGLYLITANVTWEGNATGAREINLRKNGATLIARVVQPGDPAAVNTTDQIVSTVASLAAGDYVEVVVRQNSGVSLNVLAAPEYSPEFSIVSLGPAPA